MCVCNRTYCDTFEPIERKANLVTVIESNRDGLRFRPSYVTLQSGSGQAASGQVTITFDARRPRQRILGFGLAFTDAAGIAATSLGPDLTQLLLSNYFSAHGLQYSMARVPMGGTDFSTRKYTYDDGRDKDFELKGFALQPEDLAYKVAGGKLTAISR